MWAYFASKILRFRLLILIIIGSVTVFMGFQANKVEMSYQYASLLPDDDSILIQDINFNSQFEKIGNVFIIGIEDSLFFDSTHFSQWNNYCNNLKNLDAVKGLISVSQSYNLLRNKTSNHFDIQRIFSDSVQTQDKLDSAKQEFYSLPFYKGRLYNEDENVWLMAVTLDTQILFSKDRVALFKEIDSLNQDFQEKTGTKVHISGLPYIRVAMAELLKRELKMFVILALLITTFILALLFRSFKVVFFTMMVVLVAVVWSLGFMAIFGYKVTMITGMIPPLLIVIGVPNSIFLVNKYLHSYTKTDNKFLSLTRAISNVGNATFLTNLTTSLGFATFITTRSPILVEFGILAFASIMCLYFLGILLIPIIFSFAKAPKTRHTKHLKNKYIKKILDFLVYAVANKRKYIYLSTLIIIIVGVFGIRMMHISGYMVDDIPESSHLISDLKFFEKNFNGILPLDITIDTKKKQGVNKIENLKLVRDFQDSLAISPELSSPLSIVELLKFAKQSFYNGDEKFYNLPTNKQEMLFISNQIPKSNSNPEIEIGANNLIDSNKQIYHLSYQISDLGNKRMGDFIKKLNSTIENTFPKEKFNVVTTGTSIVHYHGTNYLIRNLFESVALAIALIAFCMAWMFKSKRMVIIALIPNFIPLIMTAAIMGYFGIPLKASTILVFSIAFGISIDDTIHFLAKYRQELKMHSWNIHKSVIFAIKESGQSMIYTSIILFFGFGIFTASSFGGTAALGILISTTLLFAMCSNLLILPSLLLSFDKFITNRKFRKAKVETIDDEDF